ncbi:PqqD family protein [soil metagenome]
MTITDDMTISQTGNALSTEVDGEMVLIGLETGRYFGLDAIGTAIWKRIELPCRVDALCTGLAEDFDGDPALISAETRAFLERLVEQDLARVD